MSAGENRAGVDLTNLDQPLSAEAGATKRDLVDYLDAIADRMLPGLVGRPLTVLRVLRGRAPFMQKNVSKYTPPWAWPMTSTDLRTWCSISTLRPTVTSAPWWQSLTWCVRLLRTAA